MMCYVMLCNVMLCYVMLWYVMLCNVMLSYVMLWYVMLWYVMLNICQKVRRVSEGTLWHNNQFDHFIKLCLYIYAYRRITEQKIISFFNKTLWERTYLKSVRCLYRCQKEKTWRCYGPERVTWELCVVAIFACKICPWGHCDVTSCSLVLLKLDDNIRKWRVMLCVLNRISLWFIVQCSKTQYMCTE